MSAHKACMEIRGRLAGDYSLLILYVDRGDLTQVTRLGGKFLYL